MDKHLNDSYKLRMPAELKAKIAESAKTHNRSMNADIVARLEQSFLSASDDEKDILIEQQQKVLRNTLAQLDEMLARHLPFFEDNKKAP